MKYWVNTVSQEHVLIGVKGGFTQADHGKATRLSRLGKGDLLVFYSPRTAFGAGEPLQCFSGQGAVTIRAAIRRKDPRLPRYLEVSSAAIAAWELAVTTAVDVAINGHPAGRQSLKPWDQDRWFLDITQRDCERLGVDTGSEVTVVLSIASVIMPPELSDLIARSAPARARWEALTGAQQRMLRETVLSARSPETRRKRAEKELLP